MKVWWNILDGKNKLDEPAKGMAWYDPVQNTIYLRVIIWKPNDKHTKHYNLVIFMEW